MMLSFFDEKQRAPADVLCSVCRQRYARGEYALHMRTVTHRIAVRKMVGKE